MNLDDWQAHLEKHFASLAQERSESGFHIFVLEHGLGDTELDEISSLLLEQKYASCSHWLIWAVYATERGYHYEGDEYWPSFEERTTFWELNDRYRLARWFMRFQREYYGVLPSGQWANHFRIIAWPITHAILPRYLQRQLAKTLYELRYRIAGLTDFTPANIGRLLINHAHTSIRFEEFLQQEELTGRIVLALLGRTLHGGHDPIYPPTLERIVSDLDKVRNAREWLTETRQEISNRFTGAGHDHSDSSVRRTTHHRDTEGEEPARPSLKLKLLLRYSGQGTWALCVDVPDFRSVADNVEIHAFLNSTRCRINGAESTMPTGWLLGGKRKAVLKAWPDPQKPLIQFVERSNGAIDHLIESDCRLGQGSRWFFRIGPDGIAREVTTRTVRPGHEYIIVTTTGMPATYPLMGSAKVDCAGIESFRLRMPDILSTEDIDWLRTNHFHIARTIRVWPSGLPGRSWDGEGSSEWLTTEAPCIGIVNDHPVESYRIRLNNGADTIIEAGQSGCPFFVSLPPLSVGTHHLRIQAQVDPHHSTEQPVTGFLTLSVREPEPWIPGRVMHAGLIVTLDPHDADLDTFWENRIHLSIAGPETHRVACEVTLVKSNGEVIYSGKISDPLNLPVTPERWSRMFAKFTGSNDMAWRYLEASTGYLTIKGEELGEYRVRFEHEALPIRWVVRNYDGKIFARLIDDTGNEQDALSTHFVPFLYPVSKRRLTAPEVQSGSEILAPGGLLMAQLADYQDTVVVSAWQSGSSLHELGVLPNFTEQKNGDISLAEAICLFDLWSNARLAGPLAESRRQMVTDGFLCNIYRKICGSNWARAEEAFHIDPTSTGAIERLKQEIDSHNGFAALLARDFNRIQDEFAPASQWFSDLAKRYDVCPEAQICDFSLWLACQPQSLSRVCEDLESFLNEVRQYPAILRGARFLALMSANEDQIQPARLMPSCTW